MEDRKLFEDIEELQDIDEIQGLEIQEVCESLGEEESVSKKENLLHLPWHQCKKNDFFFCKRFSFFFRKKPSFYVYLITCTHPESPQKFYIGSRGCHVHPTQDSSYWGSSDYVDLARETFDTEWFEKKILTVCDTRNQAYQVESALHTYFQVSKHPLFFNRSLQTPKGHVLSGPLPQQVREKIRQTLTGRTRPPEVVEKMRRGHVGSKHTEATKLKISSQLGNPAHFTQSLEFKQAQGERMQKILTGKPKSETHKKNLAESSREAHTSMTPDKKEERSQNISKACKGKPKSEEHKEKLRESARRKWAERKVQDPSLCKKKK